MFGVKKNIFITLSIGILLSFLNIGCANPSNFSESISSNESTITTFEENGFNDGKIYTGYFEYHDENKNYTRFHICVNGNDVRLQTEWKPDHEIVGEYKFFKKVPFNKLPTFMQQDYSNEYPNCDYYVLSKEPIKSVQISYYPGEIGVSVKNADFLLYVNHQSNNVHYFRGISNKPNTMLEGGLSPFVKNTDFISEKEELKILEQMKNIGEVTNILTDVQMPHPYYLFEYKSLNEKFKEKLEKKLNSTKEKMSFFVDPYYYDENFTYIHVESSYSGEKDQIVFRVGLAKPKCTNPYLKDSFRYTAELTANEIVELMNVYVPTANTLKDYKGIWYYHRKEDTNPAGILIINEDGTIGTFKNHITCEFINKNNKFYIKVNNSEYELYFASKEKLLCENMIFEKQNYPLSDLVTTVKTFEEIKDNTKKYFTAKDNTNNTQKTIAWDNKIAQITENDKITTYKYIKEIKYTDLPKLYKDTHTEDDGNFVIFSNNPITQATLTYDPFEKHFYLDSDGMLIETYKNNDYIYYGTKEKSSKQSKQIVYTIESAPVTSYYKEIVDKLNELGSYETVYKGKESYKESLLIEYSNISDALKKFFKKIETLYPNGKEVWHNSSYNTPLVNPNNRYLQLSTSTSNKSLFSISISHENIENIDIDNFTFTKPMTKEDFYTLFDDINTTSETSTFESVNNFNYSTQFSYNSYALSNGEIIQFINKDNNAKYNTSTYHFIKGVNEQYLPNIWQQKYPNMNYFVYSDSDISKVKFTYIPGSESLKIEGATGLFMYDDKTHYNISLNKTTKAQSFTKLKNSTTSPSYHHIESVFKGFKEKLGTCTASYELDSETFLYEYAQLNDKINDIINTDYSYPSYSSDYTYFNVLIDSTKRYVEVSFNDKNNVYDIRVLQPNSASVLNSNFAKTNISSILEVKKFLNIPLIDDINDARSLIGNWKSDDGSKIRIKEDFTGTYIDSNNIQKPIEIYSGTKNQIYFEIDGNSSLVTIDYSRFTFDNKIYTVDDSTPLPEINLSPLVGKWKANDGSKITIDTDKLNGKYSINNNTYNLNITVESDNTVKFNITGLTFNSNIVSNINNDSFTFNNQTYTKDTITPKPEIDLLGKWNGTDLSVIYFKEDKATGYYLDNNLNLYDLTISYNNQLIEINIPGVTSTPVTIYKQSDGTFMFNSAQYTKDNSTEDKVITDFENAFGVNQLWKADIKINGIVQDTVYIKILNKDINQLLYRSNTVRGNNDEGVKGIYEYKNQSLKFSYSIGDKQTTDEELFEVDRVQNGDIYMKTITGLNMDQVIFTKAQSMDPVPVKDYLKQFEDAFGENQIWKCDSIYENEVYFTQYLKITDKANKKMIYINSGLRGANNEPIEGTYTFDEKEQMLHFNYLEDGHETYYPLDPIDHFDSNNVYLQMNPYLPKEHPQLVFKKVNNIAPLPEPPKVTEAQFEEAFGEGITWQAHISFEGLEGTIKLRINSKADNTMYLEHPVFLEEGLGAGVNGTYGLMYDSYIAFNYEVNNKPEELPLPFIKEKKDNKIYIYYDPTMSSNKIIFEQVQ